MPESKFIPQHFINNFENIKKTGYFITSGYVMFADLSGFTAMSEKLSKKGNEGSEEISRILNTIFEDLIGIIQTVGGSVYKFGGDALTIFFPDEIKPQDILNCSILLVTAMDKYSEIKSIGGKVKVEIKVGTAYGKTIIGQLGNKEKDYFLAGDTLDAACDCEHNAEKGQSIIHRSLIEKLALSKISISAIKNKSGNYFLAPNKKLTLLPKNRSKKNTNIPKYLNPFTRDILLSKEKAGEIEEGELRNCTVLFMSFTGVEYDKNFRYDLLNEFVTNVFNISSKFSGFVNKVDMGDKGSKIIILFGAPIATEKNEEFAGRCALEIIDTLPPGMKVKVGINSGNIYFGIIGSSKRLEFTVIGNAVNLSARLMTSCIDNEIIISDTVKNKIEGAETKNPRGLKLKGIKNLFKVHTIRNISSKKQQLYIKAVGRDKEIAQYKKYLTDEKTTLINIRAEAGLGKSVLAGEFEKIVIVQNKVIRTECLSYTSENPFYTIKELIIGMIGETTNSPVANKINIISRLLKKINEEHNTDTYLSFLGWDSGNKIKLDESMKNIFIDITQSIFIELFSKKKYFIFIEDIHWIDNDSLELLRSLVEITANLQCLWHLIYRPDDKLNFFEGLKYSKIIEPDNFTKDAGKRYISTKFNLRSVPTKLYNNIYSKAKGNPFYMDEIIISIREKNGLKKEPDGYFSIKPGFKNFDIPENINEIILARIDQIDDNSKRILKIASVIGRIFQVNILNQLRELQEKATTLNLRSQLFDLSSMDFTMFELTDDNEYLFKHAITRDVVYETLLFSVRRKYHTEIANIYEDNARDNIKSLYELLAFHYKLAKERDKAKKYLLLSSEKAEQNFSYTQAIKFLKDYRKFKSTNEEKAISLLREAAILKILEKRDQAIKICDKVKSMFDKKEYFYIKASILKAEILRKSSKFDDTIIEIEKLGKINEIDLYTESLAYLGYSQLSTGKIRKAANIANKAKKELSNIKAPMVKAIVCNFIGQFNLQKRNLDISLEYFNKMHKISTSANLSVHKLQALQNIAVCYANSGEYTKAGNYFEKLYNEALKIHNYDLIINSINNIANISYVTGKYKKAEQLVNKGMKLVNKLKKYKYKDDLSGCLSNIKLDQGKYKEVLNICEERLQDAKITGNKQNITIINDILGDTYFKMGNIKKALKIYLNNLERSQKIGDIEGVGHSYGNIANCYSDMDNFTEALEYYNKQIKYARKHKDKQSEGKALHNLAETYFYHINDKNKGKKFCKMAIKIYKEIGFTYGLEIAEEMLQEFTDIK